MEKNINPLTRKFSELKEDETEALTNIALMNNHLSTLVEYIQDKITFQELSAKIVMPNHPRMGINTQENQ